MITSKQVFYTSDGQQWNSRPEAENWERNRLREWLATDPRVDLRLVLDSCDEGTYDEYNCTEKEMAMNFIQKAFELRNGG